VAEPRELHAYHAQGDLLGLDRKAQDHRPDAGDLAEQLGGSAVLILAIGEDIGELVEEFCPAHGHVPIPLEIAQSRMASASASLSSFGA